MNQSVCRPSFASSAVPVGYAYPQSPVAGAWEIYHPLDRETYTGVADSVEEVPGKGLVFREATHVDVAFSARIKPASNRLNASIRAPILVKLRGTVSHCE